MEMRMGMVYSNIGTVHEIPCSPCRVMDIAHNEEGGLARSNESSLNFAVGLCTLRWS